MNILFGIFSWLTGNGFRTLFDRALETVDKKIASETDRQKLKTEIATTYMKTSASWLEAGGFYLMLIFAIPVGYHFGMVCIYSVHWCADCSNPQPWTIAALPPPMDEWEAQIIMACIGVTGIFAGLKAIRR